jgi:isopentenyl-diphosphate delta-isomerase
MDFEQFESRKRDHLRHALDPLHQASGLGGLDTVRLVHEALPELDFEEVGLSARCLGRELPTPFYVAGMTAGHAQAASINRTLAQACASRGWALGVGSQRRDLEGKGRGTLDQWTELRAECPDLFLLANIGLSQLASADPDRVLGLATELGASAIAIHANGLQEALQAEGTPRFKGGLAALSRLCLLSRLPIVLKETGCGFSKGTLSKVAGIGLGAVDVSGLGGTHWGRIEGARAEETDSRVMAAASRTFANWGEPTADSVLAAREAFAQVAKRPEIWASGGIRSGLDAAKAIALGAERVGFAKPALEAALKGREELESWMKVTEYELKIALFCTGSRSVGALRRPGSWKIIGN